VSTCQDGDVRLVNGSIVQEGRVEVCYNNLWGSLCGDGFDKSDAFVICRELGLGDSEPTIYTNSYFGDGSGPVLYSNMDCGGYENTIVNCDKSTYGSFTCSRKNIAGVVCRDACNDGDVRLVGGSDSSQGTVEVCYYSYWGLISDTMWDDNDAKVVCRELGFDTNKAKGLTNSPYGKSNKTVHLSNMDCAGNETTLAVCDGTRIPPDDSSTLHAYVNVAGVTCFGTIGNATNSGLTGSSTSYIAVGVIGACLILAVLVIIILVTVIFFKNRQGKGNRDTLKSQLKMSRLQEDNEAVNPMSFPNPDIGTDLVYQQ
jgi:deleted-in-malignant-brain-tumors protein 1